MVQEITYLSAADSTQQPAMYYAPETETPAPLLVGLHTWGGDYRQACGVGYAKWCMREKWVFIFPDFRGPNRNPAATGSELVVKDIISAVQYARRHARVDEKRIYLLGGSGGGYAALLMAGRAPEIWAGVSAWVPIADLRDWYVECKKAGRGYAAQIAASCGGAPGTSDAVDREYEQRSAVTWLKHATPAPLDINAGIHDGHTGSVPISHSLKAFNVLAAEKDRLSEDDIQSFVQQAKVPRHLKPPLADPTYGKNVPLFRRSSRNVRVTIFDGGHQILQRPALQWLANQKKP